MSATENTAGFTTTDLAEEKPVETSPEVTAEANVASVATESSAEAAVVPPPSPQQYQPTETEIQAAMQELKAARQPQQTDPKIIAQAIAEALKPVIPAPPPQKQLWEDDAIFTDKDKFRAALDAHRMNGIKQYHDQMVTPLINRINELQQIIPMLYASRAENPVWNKIQERATEIFNDMKQFGVSYQAAVAFAQKELSKQSVPQALKIPSVKSPAPAYASAPETKAETYEQPKEVGKPSFRDIITELKNSGKF